MNRKLLKGVYYFTPKMADMLVDLAIHRDYEAKRRWNTLAALIQRGWVTQNTYVNETFTVPTHAGSVLARLLVNAGWIEGGDE